jgi:hypothetical protein
MTTGFNLLVMGGTALYSPSFGRGGEAALFSVETLAKIGSPSLAIDVEHKNTEDTTWTSAGTFTAITTLTVSTADISGLKEEIRIKFTMTGTDGDAFNLLIPSPAWRPY